MDGETSAELPLMSKRAQTIKQGPILPARFGFSLALAVGCYLSLIIPVEAQPVRYSLQPDKSKLYVQIFKDRTTLASALAHDHVVSAMNWQGQVLADPAKPTECTVDVTVPVDGLQADLPLMRSFVGYESMLSESDQRKVSAQLRDKEQLDAGNYPEISFHGRSCSGTREELTVNGQLTIRGRSKDVSIPLKVTYADNGFHTTGTFTARHSDFGFSPYSAFFGAVKNRQEIHFVINVFATKQ
jgi:polyisoprenoid-binding protein YceI